MGCEVVLVSSGAIAAGREALGYPELPKYIPKKQMLAAVGQPRLMARYAAVLRIYGKHVAQVLLTRTDLADRRRYLNARNTFQALLQPAGDPGRQRERHRRDRGNPFWRQRQPCRRRWPA